MVFQPEYGHLLNMHCVASEYLPYYRFIEISTEGKFVLATGKGTLVGVAVPSVQDYMILKDGTTQQRNGYLKDEKPQILHTGVCHVELEEDVTMGNYLMLGTEPGKAKKQTGDDKGKSTILAMALDTKKTGELVRAALPKCSK
jgi:hypothetical protein